MEHPEPEDGGEEAFLDAIKNLEQGEHLHCPLTLRELYKWAMENRSSTCLVMYGSLIEKQFMQTSALKFGDPNRRSRESDSQAVRSCQGNTYSQLYRRVTALYARAHARAQEKGHKDASFILARRMYTGWCLANREFLSEESAAIQNFEGGVEEGHGEAMLWLGCILVQASRETNDSPSTRHLFTKASQIGNIRANFSLSVLCGTMVERVFDACKKGYWWNEDGLDSGTGLFGKYPFFEIMPREYSQIEDKFPKCKSLMLEATRAGHVRAMLELGFIFQHGQLGEKKNLRVAAAWYSKARSGNPINPPVVVMNAMNEEMKQVQPDFAALDNLHFYPQLMGSSSSKYCLQYDRVFHFSSENFIGSFDKPVHNTFEILHSIF